MTEGQDFIKSYNIPYTERVHIFVQLILNKVTSIEDLKSITEEFKSYIKENINVPFSSGIKKLSEDYWLIEFMTVHKISNDFFFPLIYTSQEGFENFIRENYFNFYHKGLE